MESQDMDVEFADHGKAKKDAGGLPNKKPRTTEEETQNEKEKDGSSSGAAPAEGDPTSQLMFE